MFNLQTYVSLYHSSSAQLGTNIVIDIYVYTGRYNYSDHEQKSLIFFSFCSTLAIKMLLMVNSLENFF